MQDDRRHPKDSPVWEVAGARGYLYVATRGDDVSTEERVERRKATQAGHYQTHRHEILQKQAARNEARRRALQAAQELADRLMRDDGPPPSDQDGSEAAANGEGPNADVADLFDVEMLSFESYVGMEADGEPDLGEFCRFVLHFVPPPEWPSGIPSVEGKLENPPRLLDCMPNNSHFRRIGLLVHPDKAAQRSPDVSSLPPETQTRLNNAWDVWNDALQSSDVNVDEVRIWAPGQDVEFRTKHPGLWRCWATYQREQAAAYKRVAPIKSGFALSTTTGNGGNIVGSLRVRTGMTDDEIRLINEIKAADGGAKKRKHVDG
jgi:hypothetical protein